MSISDVISTATLQKYWNSDNIFVILPPYTSTVDSKEAFKMW